jgi:hypothetical protein
MQNIKSEYMGGVFRILPTEATETRRRKMPTAIKVGDTINRQYKVLEIIGEGAWESFSRLRDWKMTT